MQESVGATSARACTWLLKFSIETGLQGYACICLYDSVVVHCPCHERHIWAKALKFYMFLANGWRYDDRILRYPIDTEYNGGWSTKPAGELGKQLQDSSWKSTPECLKFIENWLDTMIEKYEADPNLSVSPAQTA